MLTIHSLKPSVTPEEARKKFSPGGLPGLARGLFIGPLRSMAEVYVPFRLYQVEIQNGAHRQVQLFGLEAVCGALDLYSFDGLPGPSELVEVKTANRPEPKLAESRAQEILLDKVRRVTFRTGFFRLSHLSIRATPIPSDLHMPYWLGFFGEGERARIAVIDAVRRCFEGGKAREFFRSWLES